MGEGSSLPDGERLSLVAFVAVIVDFRIVRWGSELELFDEVFGEGGSVLIVVFFLLLATGGAVGKGMADLLAEVGQVLGRDLEGVEDAAGDGARHLATLKGLDDLHESELKRRCIFDEGDEARVGERVLHGEVMEAAKSSTAERRLSAGLFVETDVSAARSGICFLMIVGHRNLHPSRK